MHHASVSTDVAPLEDLDRPTAPEPVESQLD